jgi:hypothetical protein
MIGVRTSVILSFKREESAMAEINKEALLQLNETEYAPKVGEFIHDITVYWNFERDYETLKKPTTDKNDERKGMRQKVYREILGLHDASVSENTKTVLPGIKRLPRDEVIDCILTFVDVYYSMDKQRSFEKEE